MKTSVLIVAFAAGIATAQLGDVPDCAVECVSRYITGSDFAECNSLDIACICSNKDFLDGIACCLEDACDEQGQEDAVNYARQICSAQDVEVPDEVVCKNPSGSGSATTSSALETETEATRTETDDTTDAATTTTTTDEETETTGTATETADEEDATETDEPDAAYKALTPVGGVLGAVMAVALAL